MPIVVIRALIVGSKYQLPETYRGKRTGGPLAPSHAALTATTANQAVALGKSVRYASPMRYPGGKQRLGEFFARLLRKNDIVGCRYVEPFAGGGGVALYLLKNGLVNSVHLNDLDRSIYAFWFAVTRRNAALRRLIDRTPITVAEWDRQKEVQRNKSDAPLLELGFSTLFLNRTNRSGILRAGMIGGRKQNGKWLLDARFDRAAVSQRIASLHPLVSKISISCMDAVDCLQEVVSSKRRDSLAYLDPPYFVKGPDLYLNRYTSEDHQALATFVTGTLACRWVVTYDDVPKVRALYHEFRRRHYCLSYSADTRREGRELMVASAELRMPRIC